MRPPEMGRLRCETEEMQEKYQKWQEHYTFRDDHSELLFEAIQGKSLQKTFTIQKAVLGYSITHMLFRGYVRYSFGGIGADAATRPNYRPPTPAMLNAFHFFRIAKYAVAIGFIWATKWNAENFIEELKSADIYDYRVKRSRLREHMIKVSSMYQYGKTRMA